MKKSILKSSIALAVAGVFGATVAVTAAEQATPVPVTQEVAAIAAPVAEPATHQVVPTIQVTPAAKDTTPVPTATQDVKAPVAQDTVVPAAANPAAATPTIETAAVAKAPSEAKVVRAADKKVEANKDEKNTKKAQAHKAPKVKADKKETTKEEKKTLKVENHNLAQQVSKQA